MFILVFICFSDHFFFGGRGELANRNKLKHSSSRRWCCKPLS